CPHRYDALHPIEERMFARFLPQDVHGRITIHRILNQGGIQTLRGCSREAAVRLPVPFINSIRLRSLSSKGASRLRIPRFSRIVLLAAYVSYMESRFRSVTISSVNSAL